MAYSITAKRLTGLLLALALLFTLFSLMSIPANAMQIFVNTLTGKTVPTEVEPNAEKICIYETEGLRPDDQTLLLAGTELEAGNTLSDYHIQQASALRSVLLDTAFSIEGDAAGYTYTGDTLTFTAGGDYTVANNDPAAATAHRIVIAAPEGETVRLTLKGVNIDLSATGDTSSATSGDAALSVTTACTTHLLLADGTESTLKSGAFRSGIENGLYSLQISCESAAEAGHICDTSCGTLGAWGGSSASGIGGGRNDGGSITILGGNVTANGGYYGAGIGGGISGVAKNITLSGGNISAIGGSFSAGIGGHLSRAAECESIRVAPVQGTVIALRLVTDTEESVPDGSPFSYSAEGHDVTEAVSAASSFSITVGKAVTAPTPTTDMDCGETSCQEQSLFHLYTYPIATDGTFSVVFPVDAEHSAFTVDLTRDDPNWDGPVLNIFVQAKTDLAAGEYSEIIRIQKDDKIILEITAKVTVSHRYDQWEITEDQHTGLCVCGEKAQTFDHVFVQRAKETALMQAATCTSAPVYYLSCETCGLLDKTKTFTEGYETDHHYEILLSEEEPTCLTERSVTLQCTDCEAYEVFITPDTLLPHSYNDEGYCDSCGWPSPFPPADETSDVEEEILPDGKSNSKLPLILASITLCLAAVAVIATALLTKKKRA